MMNQRLLNFITVFSLFYIQISNSVHVSRGLPCSNLDERNNKPSLPEWGREDEKPFP